MAFDWRGRRVLLTGHTGFKGSWLALWLTDLGAEVTGFALPPPTTPSLFDRGRMGEMVSHVEGDVRDAAAVDAVVREARPEIVFHLAAQPLVRHSYQEPVETFATNVMGTVHVLDAVRRIGGVRAVIAITTDKCYENREWVWPYRESDPMGGHDPYSSSKGCAELAIAAYRSSFFAGGGDSAAIASVRAGNVIGGGDWAADRLVPDIIRALEAGKRPLIRSPNSIRPWQHVLEALGGYLLLAERLLDGEGALACAFNFGPGEADTRPVRWIVERMLTMWDGASGWDQPSSVQPHEATTLKLDCSKAREELGWRPALDLAASLRLVVDWHRATGNGEDARGVTLGQIREYRHALDARLAGEHIWN